MSLPEPGCYVDGHWGQYAVARSVQVAADFGWDDAEASELAAKHLATMGPSTAPVPSTEEIERLMNASDEAEEWLNEQPRPEGYYWGWNDGEFGLYAGDDDA